MAISPDYLRHKIQIDNSGGGGCGRAGKEDGARLQMALHSRSQFEFRVWVHVVYWRNDPVKHGLGVGVGWGGGKRRCREVRQGRGKVSEMLINELLTTMGNRVLSHQKAPESLWRTLLRIASPWENSHSSPVELRVQGPLCKHWGGWGRRLARSS